MMLEIRNLEKIYKNGKSSFLALKNINLVLEDKGLVIVLGKSGSGKSTLLNILGGLDTYSNGEIIIDNKSSKDFKSKDYDNYRNNYVGFVFQEFNLINEITINENIEIPLKLKKIKDKTTMIDETLTQVGLDSIGHKKCNELSGGQRQRVAIARALVKEPKIILADEPTGALDSNTSIEIFELFKKISKSKLVIIVTHNEELAYNYGDRIIKISDGMITNDITRVNNKQINKIASNVIEVESDYVVKEEDLKSIIKEEKYIGVSTNLHDLTLAYDEIVDYKKENKEDFINTDFKKKKSNNKFIEEEKSLSYKDAYKLAKDNLKKNNKKYRFLKRIFTSFSVLLIVAFIISFLSINSFISKQTTSNKSLNILEVSHKVTKVKTSEIDNFKNILNNDNYSFVNNYTLTPYYGKSISDLEFVSDNFNGIIEGEDPSKLKLELIEGNKVFENNYQIIISDYMAYNFSKYGVLISDEDIEIFYPSSNKALINKKIRIEETGKDYEIIGIYKTSFLDLLTRYNKGEDVSSIITSNINFLYAKAYAKLDFYKQYKEDYKSYSFYEEGDVYSIDLIDNQTSRKFYFSDTRLELNKDKIDKKAKYYNIEGNEVEIPDSLNDSEIILSIDHLYDMFHEENKSVQELLNTTEVSNFIRSSNLKFNLSQNNSYSSSTEEDVFVINGISAKVVGIIDTGNRIFVASNIYNVLEQYLQGYDSAYFYNSDNTTILNTKINSLKENDSSINVSNSLVSNDSIKLLDRVIEGMSTTFQIFTIIFLILSFIICLNYMNILVKSRNKELTLYRTLGAKKKDIYKIFVFESLNISSKSIIGGVIGAYLITYLLNNILSSIAFMQLSNTNILSFNLFYCLLAFISIFLICLLSAYLSVRGLLKKKLVDAFKVN